MNTYLVNLECTFPAEHRMNELNLVVAVAAESPEHIEAPLRKLVIEAQVKHGFDRVLVNQVVLAPTETVIVMSFETSKNSDYILGTECEALEPAWVKALEEPAPQNAETERDTQLAIDRGDLVTEWDPNGGDFIVLRPFMDFPDAVVAPDKLISRGRRQTTEGEFS